MTNVDFNMQGVGLNSINSNNDTKTLDSFPK